MTTKQIRYFGEKSGLTKKMFDQMIKDKQMKFCVRNIYALLSVTD